MKVAVIGANGQLGNDLVPALSSSDYDVISITRNELDMANADHWQDAGRIKEVLGNAEIIINLAAMTRVDDCEDELDEAYQVNAVAAGRLAKVARESGARLLHISTDYVFDGKKGEPYLETDAPNPISAYGASKHAGEELIRYRNPHHWIVRVSGLYGLAGSKGKGGNFIEAIMRRAQAEKLVKVVDDQTTAPTFTKHLADGLVDLLKSNCEFGTYHLAADGEVTWFDFAREIITQLGIDAEVLPIKSAALNLRANRPAYSVLRSLKLNPLPHWREGLCTYLNSRHQRN